MSLALVGSCLLEISCRRRRRRSARGSFNILRLLMVNDVGDIRHNSPSMLPTIVELVELLFLFLLLLQVSVDRLFARSLQAARLLIFNEANGKDHFACDRQSLSLSLALSRSLALLIYFFWLLYNYDHFLSSQIFGNKSSISLSRRLCHDRSLALSNSLLISLDFDTFFKAQGVNSHTRHTHRRSEGVGTGLGLGLGIVPISGNFGLIYAAACSN